MLTVIIPTIHDPYFEKTKADILSKAGGKVEVIANPEPDQSMRTGINYGLLRAGGDYIMKCDSHCMFAENFDLTLIRDSEENWLMIPRRYSLDAENWQRDLKRPVRDYHYLTPLTATGHGTGIFPIEWNQKTKEKLNDPNFLIDDTMTFQGSCWFANRKYFMNHIGLMDETKGRYGGFSDEPLEIGLKYWLGGGEVKIDKNTWYAHLSKRKHHYKDGIYKRDYKKDEEAIKGHEWSAHHWLNNEEPNMVHKFQWLVDKFNPPGWK